MHSVLYIHTHAAAYGGVRVVMTKILGEGPILLVFMVVLAGLALSLWGIARARLKACLALVSPPLSQIAAIELYIGTEYGIICILVLFSYDYGVDKVLSQCYAENPRVTSQDAS